MKPGDSFTWNGQELWCVKPPKDECSSHGTPCAMADATKKMCIATDDVPHCKRLIFVTKQQYLELRLLGQDR